MKKILILSVLVLMAGLISPVWADKSEDLEEWLGQSISTEKEGVRASWASHTIWPGTATLRDIVIGTKIKGATDDTIRLFTIQSSAPRNVWLFTDTSTSSTTDGEPLGHRYLVPTRYWFLCGSDRRR